MDSEDESAPSHDVETGASIAEAGAASAAAASAFVTRARDGNAAGAVGAGLVGAGAALAPALEALGVDDEDAAAVAAVAAAAGTAVAQASSSLEAASSATSDAGRAGSYTAFGAQLAGGAVDGARSIMAAAGVSADVQGAFGIAGAILDAIPAIEQTTRALRELVEGGAQTRRAVRFAIAFEDEPDEWQVRELEITEALNRPFRARVVISSEDLDALPDALIGKNALLTLTRQGSTRRVHGIVSRVEHGDRDAEALVCAVEIVPALAALEHCRDHRIFQALSVPEILEQLLGEHLDPYGRELEVITSRDREKRELTIQYGESALAFAHRLMEEEGLSYYFEHDEEGPERLVIVDENEHFPAAEVESDHVPFVPLEGNDHDGAEPVIELRADERVGTTDVVVTDQDWTRVSRAIRAEDRSDPSAEPVLRESHEAHGDVHYARYDPDGRAYGTDDVAIQTALRAEAHRMRRRTFRGRALAIGFAPGRVFELLGHPVSAFDRQHLLVEVTHRGRNPRFAERGAVDARRLEYECTFVCIPSDVPHRPARTTPRPRIHGVQSALVVGPSGEEIWCDEHGRIRVQFAWDRRDQTGDERTCWVRCVQSWAGAGFGTLFIPRIGMEVVVAFVGGDPDRPLVTGCVYNGLQTPPYPLPEHKTRSTLRTQSSPSDGNGYNELRFEDKAGSEEIFVHAQKDLDEVVEHDHSTRVKRNQSNTVDGTQRERVGEDQHLQVGRDRYKTIDGDEDVHVVGNRMTHVEVDATDHVDENQTTKIGGREHKEITAERNLLVGGPVTERLGDGRHCVVAKHDVLRVRENRSVHVEQQLNVVGDEHVKLQRGTTELYLKDTASLRSEGRVQVVSAGGTLELGAATELKLVCGAASITLKSNGEISISGPSKVTMASAGSSTVETAPTGVTVSGARIESSATGTHTIAGALVRIN